MILTSHNKLRLAKSAGMKGLIIFLSVACILPIFFILYFIVQSGISVINWNFFTDLPKPVGEEGGGIANALLGTVMIVLTAAIIAVPIGILAGVFLCEHKEKRLAKWVSICVDTLYGIPSIVIGIAAYFWLVRPTGGFSGISGSIALALMMVPIVIRSTEETLLQLPGTLREAAVGLGIPFHRMMLKVLLPCGMSGIVSGILLSLARVAGETAPLLFTAFGNPFMNFDMTRPMETLPLLIFKYATSPYESWQQLAWGAAFILLAWVLLLNILTKLMTKKWKTQL